MNQDRNIGIIIDTKYFIDTEEKYVIFNDSVYLIIEKKYELNMIKGQSIDLIDYSFINADDCKIRKLKFQDKIFDLNLYYQTRFVDGDSVVFDESTRIKGSATIPSLGSLKFKLNYLILDDKNKLSFAKIKNDRITI